MMTIIKDILEGLLILVKYNENDTIAAEHDVIYVGSSDIKITKEEREKLEQHGWFIDTEEDCWSHFA